MNIFKFRSDAELADFHDALHHCGGAVQFISVEGDILNLKSQLCQLLFSAAIINKEISLHGSLVCELDKDQECLAPFFEQER